MYHKTENGAICEKNLFYKTLFATGVLAIILGIFGLLSWLTPLHELGQVKSAYIPMSSDTALFFILFGLSFLFEACSLRSRLKSNIIPLTIIGLLSLYGLLKFIEFWVHMDLTFALYLTPVTDHLGAFPKNRMSPITGLLFSLSGFGYVLMVFNGNAKIPQRIINDLGIMIGCIGGIFVMGYFFGTPFSYTGNLIPLAFTTALGFCFLGLGTMALADKQSSLYRHFSYSTARGRLMRNLLPLVAIAILLEGYLHSKLFLMPNINHAFISAGMTIGFVLLTGWIISILTRLSFRKSEEVDKERLQTIEELKESEERFRLTFETNTAAFSIMRVDNFSFVKINQGLLEMSGYSSEDLLGRSVTKIDLFEDPNQLKPLIDIVLEKKKIENIELVFKRKDGSVYPGLFSAWTITLNGIPHVMTTTFDISTLKQKERELIQAQQEAVNANRLKDYFIANISHEIRTPLNAIIGFTDLLVEEVADLVPEATEMYSDMINQAGRRLLRTVDMILSISRLKANLYETKIEAIDVNEIISALVDEHRLDAAPKDIEIHFDHDSAPLIIESDFICLSQSLSNLIDNAVKYTRKGSVKISTCKLPDRLEITVQDTGIGIDEEYLDKIFEPFSQEDMSFSRHYEGIGLGLAITKQMLDAIDAKISFSSQKGIGTTVTIVIPIHNQ